MRELIDSINSRLVNVKMPHLRSIQMISLVAGTWKKAGVIHTLLSPPADQSRLSIRSLCTDDETAVEILKLAG